MLIFPKPILVQLVFFFFFLKYNFHLIFSPENISSVLKYLAPYMGFGRGHRAAPTGLSQDGGVWSSRLHDSDSR